MKNFVLLLIIVFCAQVADLSAAPERGRPNFADSLKDESIKIPEYLMTYTDTLLSNWMTKEFLDLDNNCIHHSENPFFTDSIYIERISRLPNLMEMPYNRIVRTYIDLYAGRLRERVSYMMGLGRFYFPLFEQALDAENMPLELKYIPVIESALNPNAVSRVGATGLWQFMLPTGKQYGLEINSLVDERRDPVRATQIAVKYFKALYRIYGDWGLVIAAYNCGPGNVNKAIRKAGGKRGYWDIYFHLPRETRGYLPAFIAVNYLFNYASEHNICEAKSHFPLNTDTVVVSQMIHFQQIANVLNIPVEEIKILNPSFKREIIPGNTKPYTIRLPMFAAYAFAEAKDSIVKYRSEELLLNFHKTIDPRVIDRNTATTIRHKVKKGETILSVARRYDVSVANIKSWNHLRSSKLQKGKLLKIIKQPITPSPIKDNELLAKKAKTNTQQLETDSTQVAQVVESDKLNDKQVGKLKSYSYHIVRSGDTLWAIANKYPGISVKDLMAINRLSHHDAIKVGMKIKIPKT